MRNPATKAKGLLKTGLYRTRIENVGIGYTVDQCTVGDLLGIVGSVDNLESVGEHLTTCC